VSEIAVSLPKTPGKRIVVALCAALVAFLAYSSVYAYRKPFTVATFDGIKFRGVSYQTLLIISQVIGYMGSKFFGIKFIAELKITGRFRTSVILTGAAWLSLLLFALVPAPYGMLCFFVNGFMLGFMWGIIFSYVEGRRATDFIGAVMAISFIFAGGFTRSVAKWLMIEWNISETWMPFLTGLLFAFPLLFFLWLLEKIPGPDENDIKERTIRLPMDKASREKFLKTFGSGLIIVTATYLFLTVMRDVRDNYMANIWNELGYGNNYSIFTKTETNTSLIILLIMAFLVLIRKNIRALSIAHYVIGAGFIIAGISSFLFIMGEMNGGLWMQLTGLGLYMGYIPFNCIFFERLIASFRVAGNVGFLIYFADAFGYFGSVAVMLSKEFMQLKLNWSQFYSYGVVTGSLLGLAGTIFSLFYFQKKYSVNKTVS
jgi:MFS family permease